MDFASAPRSPALERVSAAMPLPQRTVVPDPAVLAVPGEAQALAQALSCGLEYPVAALRAAVEGLASELRVRTAPAAIPGVLEEVERVARNVANLIDYAEPSEPRPLRCRLEEIVHCASRAFVPFHRPRVVVVHPERNPTVVTDGPLLSRLLERLIENALEASSEDDVLLIARADEAWMRFCVLNHTTERFDGAWALQPFCSRKPNRLGLGLPLAERDARALGGRLSIEVSSEGRVRAQVDVPTAPPSGGGEELAA